MNAMSTSKIVPYTAQEMYALVNDIEAYPEFLSWCKSSSVTLRTDHEVKATLTLSASGFTKSITTHNHMQQSKIIEMRLVEGPLNHLEAFWRFEDISASPQQCHIYFDIEFEISNRLIRMAFEPLLGKIADTIIGAFCHRADALHDK